MNTAPNLIVLEQIIEDLRSRLHAAAAGSSFLDSEVYQLSVKLDLAIMQYYYMQSGISK